MVWNIRGSIVDCKMKNESIKVRQEKARRAKKVSDPFSSLRRIKE
jgi:hypothetical protein